MKTDVYPFIGWDEVTKPENSEKKQINLQNLGLTAKTKIEVDRSKPHYSIVIP